MRARIKILSNHENGTISKKATVCTYIGISFKFFHLNPEHHSHSEMLETGRGADFKSSMYRDFPGGPVVKTSSSNAGGAGSIPGWGVKIPHASWPKIQNIKQK